MSRLPYLPEPAYVNKLKKRSKAKYLKRIIEVANERLSTLREFLNINPDYTSAALDSLESNTMKGYIFKMPRKGNDLRQIAAKYDFLYSRAYKFLNLKSSTPEGVESIEESRQSRLDSIQEEAKAKAERELENLYFRDRELGDVEPSEIDEMEKTLNDFNVDYKNWSKEDKNNFWKLYKNFKDEKGIPYRKENGEEYQSVLMAAVLSGDKDPVARAIAYLQGRISYRELIGLRKLLSEDYYDNEE